MIASWLDRAVERYTKAITALKASADPSETKTILFEMELLDVGLSENTADLWSAIIVDGEYNLGEKQRFTHVL